MTSAVAKSTPAKPAPKAVAVLKCHLSLSAVPAPGSATVNQPPSQGTQYGTVHCKTTGWGVEKTLFNVPDSGDTVGSYAQYFGNGSLRGKFNLSPSEGSGALSPSNFASESWVGTITVTSGTGPYAGAAGKAGVVKCTSGDSVHLNCTEKLSLTKL